MNIIESSTNRVVFMIPFAMAYPELVGENLPIILPALFFIALLAVGIYYEVKKDVLNWNFPKSN